VSRVEFSEGFARGDGLMKVGAGAPSIVPAGRAGWACSRCMEISLFLPGHADARHRCPRSALPIFYPNSSENARGNSKNVGLRIFFIWRGVWRGRGRKFPSARTRALCLSKAGDAGGLGRGGGWRSGCGCAVTRLVFGPKVRCGAGFRRGSRGGGPGRSVSTS
jgi:hypothetical protein